MAFRLTQTGFKPVLNRLRNGGAFAQAKTNQRHDQHQICMKFETTMISKQGKSQMPTQ
jgi:hypothetical protein